MPRPMPRTIQEVVEARKHFVSPESIEAGLTFQPRPTDLFISPYRKCGTTWTQQIVHGLRTRGSMDFQEITVVTPWPIVALDHGWDLEADQVAEPRVFKSHLAWHHVPKGARYICPVRHPYDAVVSFYRFFEGMFFEPGSITLADFVYEMNLKYADGDSYWTHLASWWEQRHNPDVLLLCYENMQLDHIGAIRAIANFMGINLDDDLLEIVRRQSTLEFMLKHRDQFDEHVIYRVLAARADLPFSTDTAKVTPGTPNHDRYQLPPDVITQLDAIWHRFITVPFGLPDYDALRAEIGTLRGWGARI